MTGTPIESYLAEVSGRLRGPGRVRRDILAELGAGLADASDAYRASGLDPARAERAAVAEFGHPERVAGEFRGELSAAQARRTAATVLASAPVIAALWTAAGLSSRLGARLTAPWHWAGMPGGTRLAIHLFVIAVATAAISALVTMAVTGPLTRWLPGRPALCGATAACGTAAIDLTLLTVLATQAVSTPGRLAVLPVAAAATGSLARFALAARAARNCLACA